MNCKLPILAALAIAIGWTAYADTETPEQKGLRIARLADEHGRGYHSFAARARMVLRDRQGRSSVREFRASMLEGVDDGDKSLIVFERPRDIRGTALLTHAHSSRDDDQWLYFPALKRVKRISAPNRSSSFVGSEFTYEDMISPEVNKFDYYWHRDEPCPGHEYLNCYVMDRYPKNPNSGYSRRLVWLDHDEYRLFKVEYYDRKNAHLKTLTIDGYTLYKDKYWRSGDLLMVNHQSGKSTLLSWSEYDFGVGLDRNDFTRRSLERLR